VLDGLEPARTRSPLSVRKKANLAGQFVASNLSRNIPGVRDRNVRPCGFPILPCRQRFFIAVFPLIANVPAVSDCRQRLLRFFG
jgi:hypothetical protein